MIFEISQLCENLACYFVEKHIRCEVSARITFYNNKKWWLPGDGKIKKAVVQQAIAMP